MPLEVIVETCQEFCDSKGAIVSVQMYNSETRPDWLHSVFTSTITVLENDKV